MKSWRRPLPVVLIGIAATLVVACIVGGSAFLVVGGLGLRSQTLQFQGPSMEPTIHDGQLLKVQDYDSRGPQRGDIIAFHPPIAPSEVLVKRVIAIPGDAIAIDETGVILNGKRLAEPYVAPQNAKTPVTVAKLTVGSGQYFVLGDNRDNSIDSRYFGVIARSSIVGRVVSISG